MKKSIVLGMTLLGCVTLLNGCLAFSLGGGTKNETMNATVGEQLVDLKKAKDAGALTDTDYDAQKAKVLGQK